MPSHSTKSIAYPLFLILLPVLFTAIIYIGYSQAKVQYREAGIRDLDRQMTTLFHLLDTYYSAVKAGVVNVDQAEESIKELLSGPMRSDGTRDISQLEHTLGPGDYLFILDSKGTLIMHPELEGQNLYYHTNSEDRHIVQELISQDRHLVTYKWQNPSDPEPREKLALVRYFPAWDWYIGISTYEENFYRPFSKMKYLLIMLVIGSYVITAILFYLSSRKERKLQRSESVSEQLVQTNQSILKTLAVALEERDAYTSGHSQRVAFYMKAIGEQMGFSPERLEAIYTGGLLHDIGKIGIEDAILMKPGKLTAEEYEIIKSHPIRGEALLRKLYAQISHHDADEVAYILTITRSHHERFDGKGYPDGLPGKEIPLVARIAAVADSFDAMTSNRAYRRGLSFSKACLEIQLNTGSQFCPDVVEAFLACINEDMFFHAHQLSRIDNLLLEPMDEQEVVSPMTQTPVTP